MKRIYTALQRRNILNNTVIVFISDNGAAPWPLNQHINRGSNFPLRMFRGTSFEGGVRNLAFLWSPLLKHRGIATEQLFHVVDWLPTLYEAAGGDAANLALSSSIAGVSQWDSLRNGERKGPRTELALNIDNKYRNYGMIYEEPGTGLYYKLLGGNSFNNSYLGW